MNNINYDLSGLKLAPLEDPYLIEKPEVSKAIYSTLKGKPHIFKISSSKDFKFYAGITVPKIEGCNQFEKFSFQVLDSNKKIIKNFKLENFECVSERHFDMTDNFSFGEVSEAKIENAAEEVIAEGAEAVIVLCTNLAGAGISALIEERTGVPVLDSVVLTLWGAFRSIGRNTSSLVDWAPAVAKIDQKAN